jgi:cytidine deaminase
VENASYSLTICAERVAVFKAVAAGERKIRAVAVASSTAAPPCGACRQVLAEFGDKDMEIIVSDQEGKTKAYTLGQLIPESFTRDYLTKKGDVR